MSQRLAERLNCEAMPEDLRGTDLRETMDLRGQVAVVAGGGGVNIGRACVDRLACLGADVVALDLDEAGARRSAEAAQADWHVRSLHLVADMTDWIAVRTAVATVVETFGKIDIWINNVGNPTYAAPFQTLDPETIRADIDRNLLSAMLGARAVLDVMIPRGRGRIINIASEAGRVAVPGLSPYCAAKAGIIGFTRALALDLRDTGVTAAGVAPGTTVGPDLMKMLAQLPVEMETAICAGLDSTTLRRAGMPEEVASMVAFLCTRAGGYVVGSTLSVSGGMGG